MDDRPLIDNGNRKNCNKKNAMRGERMAKTVWFGMVKELGELKLLFSGFL
jgi:hypothetical protein